MDQATTGWTERTVRIETLHGSIEGHVRISQLMRTLDELNMAAKAFLIVHSSVLEGSGSARSISRGSFTCLPAATRCCALTRTPIRSSL